MRPTAIFLPVIVLLLVIIVFIPRTLRPQASTSEILPSTSILPPLAADFPIVPAVSIQPVFPGLGEFATTVLNGNPDEVVGIFVEDLFALRVIQQPKEQPAFVSPEDNLVTQFTLPRQYGVVGLLAHNYLSGKLFFDLIPGDEVIVIYGDGHSDFYRVSGLERFQALNPLSPYSDFINTSASGSKRITSAALFSHIYTHPDSLVFQTCIDANGDSSWGRLFVTAVKDITIEVSLPRFTSISNN
jgi:hypothetical protein